MANRKPSPSDSVNAKRSISAALVILAGMAQGAQTLESTYRTNGPAVQSAFESVRVVLQNCSALIEREVVKDRGGRKTSSFDPVSYGTVIGSQGLILTKASEVEDASDLVVRVGSGVYRNPVVLAVDPAWDVALLRVEASGLTPADLATDLPDPERGTWVVANGASTKLKRLPQVGIISANAREIAPAGGVVLGITFKEESEKLLVKEVTEHSGAANAGIKAGDVIVSAGGQEVADHESLAKVVEKRRVGEDLEVTVEREGKKISMSVRLSGRADLFGEEESRNDQMSGSFSGRRSGFPRVIQHDILANSSTVGGPLLDLDGRCLGMNIARANRCETFAIPAGDLRSLADRLITQAGVK
jgi:serine protease Do